MALFDPYDEGQRFLTYREEVVDALLRGETTVRQVARYYGMSINEVRREKVRVQAERYYEEFYQQHMVPTVKMMTDEEAMEKLFEAINSGEFWNPSDAAHWWFQAIWHNHPVKERYRIPHYDMGFEFAMWRAGYIL